MAVIDKLKHFLAATPRKVIIFVAYEYYPRLGVRLEM